MIGSFFESVTTTRTAAGPTAQVGLLTQDMNDRCAQNLRDGIRTLQRGLLPAVDKAIAQTMPHKVFDAYRLRQLKVLLPPAFTIVDGDALLRTPEDAVFRVQDFHRKLARARVRRMIWNGGAQNAQRVSGSRRIAGCYLGCLKRFY